MPVCGSCHDESVVLFPSKWQCCIEKGLPGVFCNDCVLFCKACPAITCPEHGSYCQECGRCSDHCRRLRMSRRCVAHTKWEECSDEFWTRESRLETTCDTCRECLPICQKGLDNTDQSEYDVVCKDCGIWCNGCSAITGKLVVGSISSRLWPPTHCYTRVDSCADCRPSWIKALTPLFTGSTGQLFIPRILGFNDIAYEPTNNKRTRETISEEYTDSNKKRKMGVLYGSKDGRGQDDTM